MSDSPTNDGSEQFSDILRRDVPLGPETWLKVGGPAQYVIEPRSVDELGEVIRWARGADMPIRVLGGGSNVLVRDEGIPGVVLRLTHESFRQVSVDESVVTAGGGAQLSHAVSTSVAAGLAGLETLVGIPGTVGGAVRGNAGSRAGEIGAVVQSVRVMTATGEIFSRADDDLSFAYRSSSINELVVLEAKFKLHEESIDEVARRMRTLWVQRKATQPYGYQSAGCIFKNPRGLSAGDLIDKAGLKGTRVGKAEVSDRHANFVVTEEGATSDDVHKLIDLMKSRVHEAHGVELEAEVVSW